MWSRSPATYQVLCLLTGVCHVIHGEDWCYEGNCGPKHWAGKCKFGTAQSPVNIVPILTVSAKPGKNLTFSKEYYAEHQFEMINNGHTLQLSLPANADGTRPVSSMRVSGAGWKGEYAFLQMHFHWGSEHLVKGKRFPLELHIVHEQASRKGGLGVLGILFATTTSSKVLHPIIESLPKVAAVNTDKPVLMTKKIKLSSLLPNVWDVFRYAGSLTTPPCSEQILWSVFTQKMPISGTQANAFSSVLKDKGGNSIKHNYRPVKPVVTKTRKNIFWMPVNKKKMIENAF